ncbi:MAG TPA: hypothetical protein VGL72_16670 [Bryobacteraceae bacterium]
MNRRDWLSLGAASPAMLLSAAPKPPCLETRRTKIAAVVTVYHHYSHADVLLGRLMAGYTTDGKWTPSQTQLVSLYADQSPQNADMSRDLAARNGFRRFSSIREALTLGGPALAVDGVVFIGEHGDYPLNDVGQTLYPRYELFSQILDVYESAGRSVPTFFDKHFSYSWDKAEAIYRRAKKLGIPFMAGSSIPLTVRRPVVQPPLETPITEAVALGFGDPDAYGFHTLEAMQCLIERRRGGETGVASVEWIEGQAIDTWRQGPGSWSKPLFEPLFKQSGQLSGKPLLTLSEEHSKRPVLFVIRYRDGLRAAVLILTQNVGFGAAFRVSGRHEPQFTSFSTPLDRPLPNWDAMARCVDRFLVDRQPQNPVERTLLTTGTLAFCFESKRTGRPVDTPQLAIAYRPPAHPWFETA